MAVPKLIQLTEFGSNELFQVTELIGTVRTDITLSPGVHLSPNLNITGNSLLSSLFIKSIDAGTTVDARYFDTSSGTGQGEKFQLQAHATLDDTSAGVTNRVTVTRIHNKPFAEITVTGGDVVLGLYVTVVSSFATDLDAALQFDDSIADLTRDKGIPMMCYDEVQNKHFIIRCEDGVIPVGISEVGDPIHLVFTGVTTPGIQQTLIDTTVPALKTRKLTQVTVRCRAHARYTIESNSSIIGSGRTGPAGTDSVINYTPRESVLTGDDIKVKFTAISATPVVDVEAYLMASDLTNI